MLYLVSALCPSSHPSQIARVHIYCPGGERTKKSLLQASAQRARAGSGLKRLCYPRLCRWCNPTSRFVDWDIRPAEGLPFCSDPSAPWGARGDSVNQKGGEARLPGCGMPSPALRPTQPPKTRERLLEEQIQVLTWEAALFPFSLRGKVPKTSLENSLPKRSLLQLIQQVWPPPVGTPN